MFGPDALRPLAAVCLLLAGLPAAAQEAGEILDRPADLLAARLAGFPESLEGRPHVDIVMEKEGKKVLKVTVSQTGFLDDSVAGERTIWRLTETGDGRWQVAERENFVKCYRGGDPDWKTGLCP